MSQANVDLIKGMYDAFARGDAGAVLAGMDPGIVWNEAENFPYADKNPYVGPMTVAEGVFGRIAVEWDGFRVDVAELLDAGDTVVALGRYFGTYRATGKSVRAQLVHVWRVKDGKVTAFQQYADTAQVTAAVAG
jgi:uncharacterized protein